MLLLILEDSHQIQIPQCSCKKTVLALSVANQNLYVLELCKAVSACISVASVKYQSGSSGYTRRPVAIDEQATARP